MHGGLSDFTDTSALGITAGLMLLPKDDILFWAGQCPPTPHAPFQRASDAGTDLGVASPQLFENCNGADAGGRLQHRDDLAIPNIGKRVGPAPATRRFLPGWQARVAVLKPASAAMLPSLLKRPSGDPRRERTGGAGAEQ